MVPAAVGCGWSPRRASRHRAQEIEEKLCRLSEVEDGRAALPAAHPPTRLREVVERYVMGGAALSRNTLSRRMRYR